MRPPIDEIRGVLRQVMPEYWPISEEHNHPGQEFYKACDSDGNIYLVKSPNAWRWTSTHDKGMGMRTYYRAPPKKVMGWGDAKRAASEAFDPLPVRKVSGLKF